ncbi:aminopeptidase P family protein [Ruminococcus sp. AF14-10]|nr:aminopeptidase P family protein [Ruminococcus sp. AF14-10]
MKQNRVNAVLKNMESMNLSQILITDPLAIFYLTGRMIKPFERFYALYLNQNGNHKIFINQLETVPEDLGVEKVRFTDSDPYLDLVIKAIDCKEPLGIDKNMAARFLLPLLDGKAASGFVNASLVLDQARAVKDTHEQELMRKASKLNDMAMSEIIRFFKEGVTESELAEQLKKIYRDLGADGLSFEPLFAFGENAASGHHWPDQTKLKPGDCIVADIGCTWEGYCSDMTRTYFYKEVTNHQQEVYNLVLKANEEAEKAVAPGVSLSSLDQIARGIITEQGYGAAFTHRLGHFIGLEAHEFGDVSSASTGQAVAGNIFSIEPGVYLEKDMGVRIEDLVLVTEQGYERLNHLSKDLTVVE